MKRLNKKATTITLSFIIGALMIGGTVYGVARTKQLQETKTAIAQEEETLTNFTTQIEEFQLEGGYLSADLSQDKLGEIKNSLNQVKDSSSDYIIRTDKVKSTLEVIKTDKSELLELIGEIETRLEAQNELNSLFNEDVLTGNEVEKQEVRKELTNEEIDTFEKEYLESVKEDKWVKDLTALIKDAKSQVKQIESATKGVEKLFTDSDEVKKSVDRDKYEDVKEVVEEVQNKEVKKELESKLEGVLKEIEKREKEAEEEAKRQEELEAQRKAEEEAQHQNNQTQSYSSNTTSNSGTSNSGSSSSSNGESSSSNSSSSSSNGGSSSSGNKNVGGNVEKTGEGEISGKYENRNTYEKGTADAPEGFCEDFGC